MSGLLISWATPAAIWPRVASFSAWMTWLCSWRRAVTSWPMPSTAAGVPAGPRTATTLKAARSMAPPTVGSRTSRVAGVPLAATCLQHPADVGRAQLGQPGQQRLAQHLARGEKPVTRFMARFHTVTRPSRSVAMMRALACSISCSR